MMRTFLPTPEISHRARASARRQDLTSTFGEGLWGRVGQHGTTNARAAQHHDGQARVERL